MIEPGAAPGGANWSATLWRRSLWLVLSLAALALIVVPLIQELPLGQTTRTSLLAWLMVGVAFYWLYAGFGTRPLLLLQLLLFSTAAALLTAKLLLVGIGINRSGSAAPGCQDPDHDGRGHGGVQPAFDALGHRAACTPAGQRARLALLPCTRLIANPTHDEGILQ